MNFDSGSRTRILVDMVLDYDPTGSTIELSIDGTYYPATWLATPVSQVTAAGTTWTQTARTTGYFAGPAAVASGAVVLALGSHPTETRVTSGGDIITKNSARIAVKA